MRALEATQHALKPSLRLNVLLRAHDAVPDCLAQVLHREQRVRLAKVLVQRALDTRLGRRREHIERLVHRQRACIDLV